ncbi:MAG: 30S ribosome-binding factor RbfA [Clostridiaceae bacterium]|jgi:ribosome-binding factor A|nr:30S ribosome-binding factor RbfA [Clostridiaceae bacterium]
MERSDRVGDEMRTVLSDIIRDDLKDPGMPEMVSVVGVRVTRDLSHAYAYISVLGDELARKNCKKALERAGGFIRREIGHRMRLRMTPEVHFVFDHSIERGIEINRLIDEVIGKNTDKSGNGEGTGK